MFWPTFGKLLSCVVWLCQWVFDSISEDIQRYKSLAFAASVVLFTMWCTLVQSAVLRSHVVCLSLRLSVRLSVTLVDCDHIGWNSCKIISPLVSLGCLLSADSNIRGLLQGEHPEIFPQSDPPPVDLSVVGIRLQIAAEWLQIAQRSQWRTYRKPRSLFRMVPSLTPFDLPFPQNGGSICPQDMRMAISPQWVIRYTMFGSRVGFSWSADRMVLFPVASNPSWR